MEQVSCEVQRVMSVQASHVSLSAGLPAWTRKRPLWHCVHCEFRGSVHDRADVQPAIGEQSRQTSAGPVWSRNVPDWHVWHCESVVVRQVSGEVQPSIGVHARHVEALPLCVRK